MLTQLVEEAHTVIQLTAISSEQEPHSTIAAFLINPGGDCHWAHAGDSRVYHFRGTELVARTKDHSYVQALVDRGELTEEQAQYHPQSNILIGCLGADDPPPQASHLIPQIKPGDTLMACSDGVWHYFSPQELGKVLGGLSPRHATEFLIDKARERAHGRGDNLSIIVVKAELLDAPQQP
jgi:serine/threonine protein phosphatase PrpC